MVKLEDYISVLLTKKLAPEKVSAFGVGRFVVYQENFIEIEPLAVEHIKEADYNIITSSSAVESLQKSEDYKKIRQKKVFCVGEKTEEKLRSLGFEVIERTDYARELALKIVSNYSDNSFNFFCGNLRSNEIPKALMENKIEFYQREVYKTKIVPHKIEQKVDAVLFFSPSAVQSYLQCNSLYGKQCFCIGNTTGEFLKKYTQNVFISKKPTIEDTIRRCVEVMDKK